jgi:hypothetical protein
MDVVIAGDEWNAVDQRQGPNCDKSHSSGLGLAIGHDIVAAHHREHPHRGLDPL